MPLRRLRVWDSNNKIKPYTEYSLCQKHEDCYEYGFVKEHGGGCYYERLSVKKRLKERPKRPGHDRGSDKKHAGSDPGESTGGGEDEDGELEDNLLSEDEDTDKELMSDRERNKILLVKVCKMQQNLEYTSASNRCLTDSDCPPAFYCHDVTFKCTFISNYGDRCGAGVVQDKGLHALRNRGPARQDKPEKTSGKLSKRDLDLGKGPHDPCPKGLACHPEIKRCVAIKHAVRRNQQGKVLCKKYADCPPSHYCSLELEKGPVSPMIEGQCLPKFPQDSVCLHHRQCQFGLGCVEERSSVGNFKCHRRCYTNLDCYPTGTCTNGNFSALDHLPNLRFCFGDRPVLYADAESYVKRSVSSDSWILLAAGIFAVLMFVLSSFLAVYFYKRSKHKSRK